MLRQHLISKIIFIAILTMAIAPSTFAQFLSSDFVKLNRFVQTNNSTDNATKAFRIGRDLIEDEKWEQAEKRFRDFLRDYPKHKESDAAIYWLAFTQKKQQHFAEAEQLLVKLTNEYPKSNWLDDAKALRLEIAPSVGNVAYVTEVIRPARPAARAGVQDVRPRPLPAPEPAAAITFAEVPEFPVAPLAPLSPAGLAGLDALSITTQASVRSGMDEKDEIKAIALQSLMQSNPERALPYIADILKNDSKASSGLKEHAIRLLGQSRGSNSVTILLDLARGQSDVKLRRSAIYSLSNIEDDKVFDLLSDLASKSEDVEISKAALRALANTRNPKARQKLFEIARSGNNEDLRGQAVQGLVNRGDETLVDELVKIYQSDKSLKVRKQVISGLSQMVGHGYRFHFPAIAPGSGTSIGSASGSSGPIVRSPGSVSTTPKQAELLDRRSEAQKKSSEKAVKALLQLFDAEADESLKNIFLSAFSQSNSKEALQKLMQIAKSDSSMALRRRAVMHLGQSNDPDAAKFMEELLK